MEIRQAEMLNHFETGIFAALDEKKEQMMKSGKKVYNLSVALSSTSLPLRARL